MKRRAFTSLLAAGCVPLRATATDADSYARDIEFFLDELPKHAGRFFELKKVDWEAVRAEFLAAVPKVMTDGDHLVLCSRLLARLKDGHAGLVDMRAEMPDESNGRRWTGPRVHLMTVGDEVFVRAAFGEAADRGLKPGQRVVSIDGQPSRRWLDATVARLRDTNGYSTDHQALHAACHWGLADWSGTTMTFLVQQADGADRKSRSDDGGGGKAGAGEGGDGRGGDREIAIERNGGPNFAPIGPVFFPPGVERLGRQAYGKSPGGFGYIHLRDVPADLPTQLDTMLSALSGISGMILDLRGNGGGGCESGPVIGRFLPKGSYWGEYESVGETPFAGPMVVLVDAGTRSAGETVAGLFIAESRAYGLGESPTAGMSGAKTTIAAPSGLFSARVTVRSYGGRWNKGRGIEGIGISPTEVVAYEPAELLAGVDTLIRRADRLLAEGFPTDAIDYQPPSSSAQ